MAVDEASLLHKHEVVSSKVASSTQISAKTEGILTSLSKETDDKSRSTVVRVTAESKSVGKLISIVEIVKRELATRSIKCHQYNELSSELKEIPRLPTAKTIRKDGDDAENEDDAFETMGADGSVKKRNVPVMTVYLSRVPIKELRAKYGEQR